MNYGGGALITKVPEALRCLYPLIDHSKNILSCFRRANQLRVELERAYIRQNKMTNRIASNPGGGQGH